MTLDEFLTRLEATPRAWRISNAVLRCDGLLGTWCPITAVAALEGHPAWDLCQWEDAAALLGLTVELGHRIATAADNDAFTYPPDARLRDRLRAACGLAVTP